MHRIGVFATVALLGLAGCDEASLTFPTFAGQPDATAQGIRTLSLFQGAARVRAPDGYCIDQSASRARSGFVMMAGCALLSDDMDIMPTLDGLLTVQFGDQDSAVVAGNEGDLADLLQSEAGMALLSGATPVSAAEIHHSANRVILRHDDTGEVDIEGTTHPIWRGFMDVQGRLVTVTVHSFDRAPLGRRDAQRLLEVAMAEIEQVNADAAATADN